MEFETYITKRKNNMKETIGEKIKRLRKEMGYKNKPLEL